MPHLQLSTCPPPFTPVMLPDQLWEPITRHISKLEVVLQLALIKPAAEASAASLHPHDMCTGGAWAASHVAQDLVLHRLQSTLLGSIGMPHGGAILCNRPHNSQQHDAFHICVQLLALEDACKQPFDAQALVLHCISMLIPAAVIAELDTQVPVVSILRQLL